MSDDIVTMLRREYDYFNNDGVGDYELLTIAADEIKRLQAENNRAWERVTTLEKKLKECSEEVNRISEELARTYE